MSAARWRRFASRESA